MADQHWERLEELFEQARAMPIDARAAFLERGCAGDPVLRAEVQALLGADETARALSVERLHGLAAEQTSGGWRGRVIFDV
jgi:hypothetical protein